MCPSPILNSYFEFFVTEPDEKKMSPNRNHLTSALERVEETVSDKRRNYVDKIRSIILAWGQLAFFVVKPVDEWPPTEFETIFLQTLRVVLSTSWAMAKEAIHTHVKITLLYFIDVVSASGEHANVLRKSRSLVQLVHQPWSHPTLKKILRDEQVDFIALLEYFQFENAQVIAARLAVLLEERKYELAIRLSRSWLITYNNSAPMELDYNQRELDYITDVYFCTLYKGGMLKQLIMEIRVYSLNAGLQLLRRLRSTREVVSRYEPAGIWKVFNRVTELVGDTLLTDSIVVRETPINSVTLIRDLISEWVAIHRLEDATKFSPLTLVMMRKLVIAARSTKYIYLLCSFLEDHYRSEETDVEIMRWLIRAINRDINEIEHSRVHRKLHELKAGLERLSGGYVLMSELFGDSKHVYRECLLTAFSLTPSLEALRTIELIGDDSFHSEPTHPEFKAVPAYYSELENMSHIDETLKVDIHAILRHQRPHTLSWELGWSALKANCVAHLQTFEARGFGHEVKLNHLHLDYNLYKDLPIKEEDYIQIEKGYEHFLAIDNQADVARLAGGRRRTVRRGTKPRTRSDAGDTRRTVRRGKRPAEKSDGESRAKKRSTPPVLSICLPRLSDSLVASLSKHRRSPVQGKRLTMRIEVPSQMRNNKPAMPEIVDGRLDNALQSIIETFGTPKSSLVARDSSPHATQSRGNTGPTVPPITIRRNVVIDPEKSKECFTFTLVKRSAHSSS